MGIGARTEIPTQADFSLTLLVLYKEVKELYLQHRNIFHALLYFVAHAYMSYSLLVLLISSNIGFPLSFKGTVSRNGYFFGRLNILSVLSVHELMVLQSNSKFYLAPLKILSVTLFEDPKAAIFDTDAYRKPPVIL